MRPVIRLTNVSKRFGDQTALDDVSLEVAGGVVFALLGENGAGKTTAIRILLGLAEADAGSADVLGLDSRREGLEIRRRVGYVPEQPTLYEWMTVAEVGWFTAGFYGDGFLPCYQRLAQEFGLPMNRRLKALSKGMRAKVSLSLAMAHEPELLVLDEPTSGLDTLVRREFLESMVDQAAAGRTVLLSSHQISEVERVADIVAIMHQGRLALVEPLDELKRQVRQVTVTLDDGKPLPSVPGVVLREQLRARQWQAMIRCAEDEDFDHLRSHASVRELEVHAPSLEEIFVAYVAPGGDAQRRPIGEEAGAR